MSPRSAALLCALALACPALAASPGAPQNGDQAGEEQPQLDRKWPLPASPPLSPEQQRATFRLPEGYVIEAIATEPLIGDPVDIAWDARGRMWVVEMTSLMRDADATGELEPDCCIAILSDTDGDGIYDHREVFLDDLVLPRSVCFVPDGVVAILPPQIVFLQDEDGDGEPDRREVLADGLTAGLSNPEHAANSLTLGFDNWVYAANHGWRYRRIDGEWVRERSARIGQWGMSEDDFGRMAVNYNSAAVHVSVVPLAAAVRNDTYGTAKGTNMRTTDDTSVYPSRVNPGVNRGYRVGTLRDDGRLAKLTGACGPAWFTGTALAEDDRGRLFSCEPCGNLVQRFDVDWVDGLPQATLVRNQDGLDFLTSTDERFRPVNLRVGPDGALYVVDLYRGILQHKVFLTSFLRRQAEERGLGQPTGLGRIWRIRREGTPPAGPVSMAELSSEELIAELDHPNKWQRMTAQRLLVERGATPGTVDALHSLAVESTDTLEALHALASLEGLGFEFDHHFIREIPKDRWRVPANIRSTTASSPEDAAGLAIYWAIEQGSPESIREGLYASNRFGPSMMLGPTMIALKREGLLEVLQDPLAVDAILSGLTDLELTTILGYTRRVPDDTEETKEIRRFVQSLARILFRQPSEAPCLEFLESPYVGGPDWVMTAFLEGAVSALPANPSPARFRFSSPEPRLWSSYRRTGRNRELVKRLDEHLQWNVADPVAEPETGIVPSYLQRGAEVYARSCGTCHQPDGAGMAGLAPPLAGSEWLALPDRRLVDIALNGLQGPIEVDGQAWDQEMPGWPTLSDQEIAAVLSYILQRWAEEPHPIDPALVRAVRAAGTPIESED